MKISYATLVHNERVEIERLLSYLIKYKKSNDEIVIMLDSENVTYGWDGWNWMDAGPEDE